MCSSFPSRMVVFSSLTKTITSWCATRATLRMPTPLVQVPERSNFSTYPLPECGLSTFERAFVAEDRVYHVDCLRCTGCYRTIALDDGFFFRDMMLYDDTCFIFNAKENE